MNHKINISLYWKIQLIAWSITSFYWGYSAYLQSEFIWTLGVLDFISDMVIGITLTHFYRNFALKRQWNTQKLNKLIPKIAIAVFILSILYTVLIIVKLYTLRLFFILDNSHTFLDFFISKQLQVFASTIRIMLIWVLAYHMYHFSTQNKINFKEKYKNKSIDQEVVNHIEQSLAIVAQKELFLNPNLTLTEVAKEFRVSKHTLSQYLNETLNKSFSTYLNEFRVEKAKELLQTQKNYTIETLGYESGFNSKSTFYAIFKKNTGLTPAQYRSTVNS